MKVFPIPVNTPFADQTNKNNFNITWMNYLKTIGDSLIQSSQVSNATNTSFKYVLNGCMVICNYYVTTPVATAIQITLPYVSLLAFEVDGTIYPPNTKSITIPANKQFLQFMYLVNLQ